MKIALPAAALLFAAACSAATPGEVVVRPPREVEFSAVVHASAFDGPTMAGYHAIVWRGGNASHAALLEADVTDVQVLDAIEKLGARPGNNVPMEAWERRRDAKSAAPDTVIAGPAIDILVVVPGQTTPLALSSILTDSAGVGLDLKLGGHRANIPIWKSGCIVCLYSCPGSKIGNARATERDYAAGKTRFRVRPGVLPKDGTRVRVIVRLRG